MNYQATRADAYQLLHDGRLALARAERQGMRVDTEYCEKTQKSLTRKVKIIKENFEESNLHKTWKKIYRTNVKLDSDYQLAHILYTIMKIDAPKKTDSGNGATDVDALTLVADDVPELKKLIRMRKLKKAGDYLANYEREAIDGYVHPSFNLHTVRTYRSSSSNPNFQNVPKRDKEIMKICRSAIYPRPGHQLMEVDFGSIEVKVGAAYHYDPVMLKYVTDPTTDMHGDMAAQIFKIDNFSKKIPEHKFLRNATKNGFVFAQFYGDYYVVCAANLLSRGWGNLPKGFFQRNQGCAMPDNTFLSDHLINNGIPSYQEFVDHIEAIEDDFWNRRFKVYQEWKEKNVEEYNKNGYVDMFTGFRCSGVMRRNQINNIRIQGSAFHCLLWCFIQLDKIMRKQKWRTKLIGQIHDAIIVDVHPAELNHVAREVKRIMTVELPKFWTWINVPLSVEFDLCPVDASWCDKKDFKIM